MTLQQSKQIELFQCPVGRKTIFGESQTVAGRGVGSNPRKVFIYTLAHPISKEVRYIGKTVNLTDRYCDHLQNKWKTPKSSWVKSLLSQGIKPEIELLETLENPSRQEWEDAEKFWISSFRLMGAKLTNLENGGGGMDRITCEIRSRMSAGQKFRKKTDLEKRKMSETYMSFSPEKKAAIAAKRRASMLGKNRRPCPEEIRKRISATLMGRKITPEQKARQLEAISKRIYTDEMRARMRRLPGPFKGKTHNEAARAAISAAQKARIQGPLERLRRGLAIRKFYENKKHQQKEISCA